MPSSLGRLLALVGAVVVVVAAPLVLGRDPAPYVVTAIDYHFHDAHPTPALRPGQTLAVENQGSNVHNVTIPALGFSRDVAPGERLEVGDVAAQLEPGRYELRCLIHEESFGMIGVIVVGG